MQTHSFWSSQHSLSLHADNFYLLHLYPASKTDNAHALEELGYCWAGSILPVFPISLALPAITVNERGDFQSSRGFENSFFKATCLNPPDVTKGVIQSSLNKDKSPRTKPETPECPDLLRERG